MGYQKSLYSDSLPTLEILSKSYRLGIFSEGVLEFQLTKLNNSGLLPFLSQNLIFIFKDKSDKAERLVKKIGCFWVVDDNFNHISLLMASRGVVPVWINRKAKVIASLEKDLKIISSLRELPFVLGLY